MSLKTNANVGVKLCCMAVVLLGTIASQAQASPVSSVMKDVLAVSGDTTQIVPGATTSGVRSADTQVSATPEPGTGDIPIGTGDLLELRVFGIQDMDQDARVSGTGDITVSLLGPVHVQGLTPVQAQTLIETRFKEAGLLRNPHVTIFTKEYATQGISVLGEVQKPGVYPILGARRLYDAISLAGGTTSRAGRRITITRRDHPDQPVTTELTDSPAEASKKNVEIFPGDTIIVSKAGVVYVVGDVQRPSGFAMDNDEKLSVLQAIALAGGANHTAKLNKARIIRKSPSGLQEIPMPLDKILSAKADDPQLQADDILFVPSSTAKSAAHRGLEAIVAVTTGLAIYRF